MARCRAFSYLLQPTAGQRQRLTVLLEVQRELYNAALEERRGAWRWEHRRVTRYDQYRELTGIAGCRPDLTRWGICVSRGTLLRLDRAFEGFFRRVRAGQKPGFPRFRGRGRFDSVEYPDRSGWRLDPGAKRVHLMGVGAIKLRLHRPLRGTPKTCTVRREGRRWRVTIFCSDVPAQPLPETGKHVGIDLGVVHLATTSDGEHVLNPRPGAQHAEQVGATQRDLACRKRGSLRRRRAGQRIGTLARKAHRQRLDAAHKTSRRLVDDYDLIAHEKLQIANMVRRPAPRPEPDGSFAPNRAGAKAGLNRSILDAGWGLLLRLLAYKAEDAGRQLVAVDAHHTSQTCSTCGHSDAGNRQTQAEFRCTACGHHANADINAAINILRAGQAQRTTSVEREVTRSNP